MISNRYAKCQVHHLFFPGNFVSRHSFMRGQSIPRQTARRRLPFTNSRAKQPRSTDRELRSSSFPLAIPISRSVSSCSPYQFVACWPSVRRRTGSPLGSSTDLHQVLFHQFPVAAISSSSRQVAAISQAVAAREQQNFVKPTWDRGYRRMDLAVLHSASPRFELRSRIS